VSPRKVIRSPIKQATFCSYNAEICKSGTSANGQAKKKDFYLSLPGNIGTKFRNSQRFPKKKKKKGNSVVAKKKKKGDLVVATRNKKRRTKNLPLEIFYYKAVSQKAYFPLLHRSSA
jgi:hypothetical protein